MAPPYTGPPRNHNRKLPARIGILTAYPREAFESTMEVIEQQGHIADVIEWKHVIPSLADQSFAFEYDGRLKVGGLGDYDLLFNHFCGFRLSYYYFAFKAVCTTPIVNDWDGVVIASDKLKTLITARASGIRIPDTLLLNNTDFEIGITQAEKRLSYPMIMKEVTSDNGEKVYLVNSRKDAWRRWNESDRHDLFLLQEFVEGEHLRVVVLGDRVLYSVRNLIAPDEFRANARYNIGVERFPLLVTEQQQMVDVAKGIGLDYVGLDVVRNDGGLWLMEANAKPGTHCDMQLLAEDGMDLYREIGLFLLDRAISEIGL